MAQWVSKMRHNVPGTQYRQHLDACRGTFFWIAAVAVSDYAVGSAIAYYQLIFSELIVSS